MVKRCVPSCKNSSKGSKMHILPKDKKIRIQWCFALGKKNLIIDVESKKNVKNTKFVLPFLYKQLRLYLYATRQI
ncbi:unnamed protein product [Psylliodes chrysocephalus]|uniref:Uncharacterized protein n=1 Tax=Psylliodes chrysocephalus TaxID=3402493 RepID=A0A9P0CW25_9CUCU|nr:unnamed protein product [Psylliodes chrysocephala]